MPKPLQRQKISLSPERNYPRTSSENDALLDTLEDWEDACIRNATSYIVCLLSGTTHQSRQRQEFTSIREAMRFAVLAKRSNEFRGVLLYAVTDKGRSFCLPPKHWLHLLTLATQKG